MTGGKNLLLVPKIFLFVCNLKTSICWFSFAHLRQSLCRQTGGDGALGVRPFFSAEVQERI